MKIETFLKSAMIIGLLAGATDVNAAKTAKNAVGKDLHCPDITVENNSTEASYQLQIIYQACGKPGVNPHVRPIEPMQKQVFSIHPDTEFRIDRKVTNTTATPNLWNRQGIVEDTNVDCTGDFSNPSCGKS